MSAPSDFRRATPEQLQRDVAAVRDILSGSVDAWQAFVARYSRLIFSVLNQQLFCEEEDDLHTVYVEVLSELYEGKLAEYEGRASLSTWLVLVTRGRALDFLRKKRGRRRLPEGYVRLSGLQREVFQLFYVEHMPIEVVTMTLNWEADEYTSSDVSAAIAVIEETIDRRYLRRIDSDRQARDAGIDTGRELAYITHLRAEHREHSAAASPDALFDDSDRAEIAGRLKALVADLPDLDRKVVEMKYTDGMTAIDISDALELGGQRKVYSILERVTRRLRKALSESEDDPGGQP